MNFFKKNKGNELVVQNNLPTIQVRDLKEYLVRDFEQIQANEIEISNLNKKIERLEKEIDYMREDIRDNYQRIPVENQYE